MIGGHDGSYFCEGIAETLWRTDGTTAGTVAVATPSAACEYLHGAAVLPGLTLMDVCRTVPVPPHDEEERCETFRTDGTAGGTVRFLAPIEGSSSTPQTTRSG